MSDLARLQQQFVAFLRGKPSNFQTRISNQPPVSTKVRLGIYQNAYQMRLRETIDSDHAILGTYLGDELFDNLVEQYIRLFPSKVKSLRYFCDGIPQLLAEQLPFSKHPILSPLAAFERILLSAFDAKDAQAITVNHLTKIPAEQWPDIKLTFHPSVRIFDEKINAVETWQALKNENEPPAPQARELSAYWLIWRNQERLTEFKHITPSELVLLQHFLDGGDFTLGCEILSEYMPVNEVPLRTVQFLQAWLGAGLITQIMP